MAASTKKKAASTKKKAAPTKKKAGAIKKSRTSTKKTGTHQAASHLDAHGHAIDALHKKLAGMQGAHDAKGRKQLQTAVDKYKKAHGQFVDDVLYCVPNG